MKLNILSVSDTAVKSLEMAAGRGSEAIPGLDLLLSCGDLKPDYLEMLADGLNRRLLYVSGNHYALTSRGDYRPDRLIVSKNSRTGGGGTAAPVFRTWSGTGSDEPRIAGQLDLHGRIDEFRDWLVAGFGGCRWYGGKTNEYTERQMRRTVGTVARKVRWIQLKDRIRRRPPRPVIVISHAPPAGVHDRPGDPCHTGFQCFHDLIERVKPVLWVHGHIHLPEMHEIRSTIVVATTVVNAYGHKYIAVRPDGVSVSYKADVFRESI